MSEKINKEEIKVSEPVEKEVKETKKKGNKNTNLHKAKKEKNDEFYTQLCDIEKELKNYKDHFKNKVVYCNCDNPEWSNFYKYFKDNFKALELKNLISTYYLPEIIKEDSTVEQPTVYKTVFDGVKETKTKLKENGDFRSPECIELLKETDIVVTNPPFSLFREYVAQLIEYQKKFLIIGSQNAITYKEIFPLIKDNKLWLGNNFVKEFKQPDGSIKKFGNICWYTNLDFKKRHEEFVLTKEYSKEEYPKYDNYDVINVNRTQDIPKDYKGVMGVPISFLDKYNPEQFEILGIANSARWIDYECLTLINQKKIYNRIIIKLKEAENEI